MKLANCNEHTDHNDPSLPCWKLRHDDGRKVTPYEMYEIVQQRDMLLAVLKDCDEAMEYMSEYDIPLCLPDRVKAAIAKTKVESHE